MSQNQKANKLILIGNYHAHNLLCQSNKLEFVSSCDIPNLQIKITIGGKTHGEEIRDSISKIVIIIIIIVVIIAFLIIIFVFSDVCYYSICPKKQINPTYAPIQPPDQGVQQYNPPTQY